MRIKTNEAGLGRSPFVCIIPNASGSKAGSSTLVYWDDSKSTPPSKKGDKRTIDGPTTNLVENSKGTRQPTR